MDIYTRTLILILAAIPLASATFFPFNTFRPPIYPTPRFGYRPPPPPPPQRPPSNYIPLQSPILGVRVYVPRALYDLFNMRPPGTESNFPRPYSPPLQPPLQPPPYHPSPYHPPNSYFPENHPNDFPPPNYPSPRGFPGRGFPERGYPPINPDTFINLMRAFYPDLIYQPDPRYPNVFAVRIPNEPLSPPTHLPDYPLPHFEQGQQQQPQQPQQSQQPQLQQQQPGAQLQPNQQFNGQISDNRQFNGQIQDNRSQFSVPQLSPLNNLPQLNRSPQNQLIIIRSQ